MAATRTGPDWLYRSLPANADADAKLLEQVEQLCSKLPETFRKLQEALDGVRALASYEPAANRANELIWERFEELASDSEGKSPPLW